VARIRGLKPDFFKDEDLATLPFEARILFQGLWCLADKKGRLKDRPKYIKAEIFPYDNIDVNKLLDMLSSPQIEDRTDKIFIRRYEIGGIKYIDIPAFLEHQSPHHTEKNSVIPDFNGSLTVKERYKKEESKMDTIHIQYLNSLKGGVGEKKKYGEFKNVLLTDDEHKKLEERFNSSLKDRIEALSSYMASKGKRYSSHYATILAWERKNSQDNKKQTDSAGRILREI
jgi:hypothetical protein